MKLHIISFAAEKTPYLENFASWIMSQNVLNQSDCRIRKSTINKEKIDESTWFLACRYRFRVWLKLVKNDFDQTSGFLTQVYLKSKRVGQCELLHAEINLKKIKGDLRTFILGPKLLRWGPKCWGTIESIISRGRTVNFSFGMQP